MPIRNVRGNVMVRLGVTFWWVFGGVARLVASYISSPALYLTFVFALVASILMSLSGAETICLCVPSSFLGPSLVWVCSIFADLLTLIVSTVFVSTCCSKTG